VSDGQVSAGAFLDTGLSNSWGVVTNTMSLQITGTNGSPANHLIRLDTSLVHDDPDAMTRLTLGDAISRGTDWAGPVRFGGVQFGTDFGLQPQFIYIPMPSFSGQAALPSTVQAYVNDALRFSSTVPQGPFDIQQIPAVTGSGNIAFTIANVLGVQQTITVPYYASSHLLKAGLDDYSVSLGFLRNDYTQRSFDYGTPLATANYRRGLSDDLTAEAHVDIGSTTQLAGLDATFVVPTLGEFSAAVAGSHSGRGDGVLGRAAYSYIGRIWSASLSYQVASQTYLPTGVSYAAAQYLKEAEAYTSLSLGSFGEIAANFTLLSMADHSRTQVVGLSYSVPVSDRAYVNAFAQVSHNSPGGSATAFGLLVTVPLGSQASADAGFNSDAVGTSGRLEYQKSAPFGTGFGYDLSATPGNYTRADGTLIWRNSVSTITTDVADTQNGVAARILSDGSLAYSDGTVFAARDLGSAFGVASVSGYRDVRVYQENQLVGRTDSDGRLPLPQLAPYQDNHIRIDPRDLPLSATMTHSATTLVPAYGTGVVADFAVHKSAGAVISLMLPGGRPFPAGVPITVDGRADAAFSGYDGDVYVQDIHDGSVLSASWDAGNCRVRVPNIPKGVLQPRIGPLVCTFIGGH
ncbi:MAG: fimbrial biogenesis outer membrane usher protein, partial [Alphaproteobacteria bacterium]|nr:fimbrial biogenesis outer membrane usher protein [Alphaproteobacteria bacterium]